MFVFLFFFLSYCQKKSKTSQNYCENHSNSPTLHLSTSHQDQNPNTVTSLLVFEPMAPLLALTPRRRLHRSLPPHGLFTALQTLLTTPLQTPLMHSTSTSAADTTTATISLIIILVAATTSLRHLPLQIPTTTAADHRCNLLHRRWSSPQSPSALAEWSGKNRALKVSFWNH